MTQVPIFLSQKFKFWSFVSMVLLVFVHGYNLELRYLQPWTTPNERLSPASFTEYFLANGLFRFRIPMLFVISGFLYALHDEQQPNKQRVKKRIRTLLVPYFAWSAIGLLLTYVLEIFPVTRNMVLQSHVVQIDENRMLVHNYHWYEVLARWIFFPVSYQLWFIRVLFIYNLAYPLIRKLVLHPIYQKIFFSVAVLMWLATFGIVLIEGEGLLFFSLGVWIQKAGFNITTAEKWRRPFWCGIVFITLAAIKTWVAFKGYALVGNGVFPVLILLHKAVVLSGMITAWFGCDKLVMFFMQRPWFVWLSAFSFIIYALHAPMVAFVIDVVFNWLRPLYGYRAITFILLPASIVVGCILIGATLRKLAPKIYGTLTGGRGL